MKEDRLKHLFVEELKDIYSSENQMVKALPKLANRNLPWAGLGSRSI